MKRINGNKEAFYASMLQEAFLDLLKSPQDCSFVKMVIKYARRSHRECVCLKGKS